MAPTRRGGGTGERTRARVGAATLAAQVQAALTAVKLSERHIQRADTVTRGFAEAQGASLAPLLTNSEVDLALRELNGGESLSQTRSLIALLPRVSPARQPALLRAATQGARNLAACFSGPAELDDSRAVAAGLLREVAAQHPSGAERGQLTSEALRLVAHIDDSHQRAEELWALVPLTSGPARTPLVRRALAALRGADSLAPAQVVWSALTSSERRRVEACTPTPALANPGVLALALRALLPQLTGALRVRVWRWVFARALREPLAQDRFDALRQVFTSAPKGLREAVARKVLAVPFAPSSQARWFTSVGAPALTRAAASRVATAWLRRSAGHEQLAAVRRAVLPFLSQKARAALRSKLLSEARQLAAERQIPEAETVAEALLELLRAPPSKELIEDVLAALESVENEEQRCELLQRLRLEAPLRQADAKRVLAMALAFREPHDRSNALASVTHALAGAQRAQAITEGYAAALAIESPLYRSAALREWVPALQGRRRTEAIDRGLAAARSIHDEDIRFQQLLPWMDAPTPAAVTRALLRDLVLTTKAAPDRLVDIADALPAAFAVELLPAIEALTDPGARLRAQATLLAKLPARHAQLVEQLLSGLDQAVLAGEPVPVPVGLLQLERLPPRDLYRAWSRLLRTMGSVGAHAVLHALAQLPDVLTALGGPSAVAAVAEVLMAARRLEAG